VVLRPNHSQTVDLGFKAQKNTSVGFEAKPGETIIISFEAKLEKTVATGFEAKPVKTIRVVLRSNHSQTIAIGFEAQTNEKPSTLVLRLNQETRPPRLHVHGAGRTRHPTS
jgi:hypothetical protein